MATQKWWVEVRGPAPALEAVERAFDNARVLVGTPRDREEAGSVTGSFDDGTAAQVERRLRRALGDDFAIATIRPLADVLPQPGRRNG